MWWGIDERVVEGRVQEPGVAVSRGPDMPGQQGGAYLTGRKESV